MSDRTSFQAYVYDCPEDQRAAAHDVLATDYGLGLDWDARNTRDELSLTDAYSDHEMRVGSAQEIAEALREAAPGASFVLWEDPAYEWLGDVYAYAPGLGMFHASCDGNGAPVFTGDDLRVMVRDAGHHAAEGAETVLRKLTEAINWNTGAPWFEDWASKSKDH